MRYYQISCVAPSVLKLNAVWWCVSDLHTTEHKGCAYQFIISNLLSLQERSDSQDASCFRIQL